MILVYKNIDVIKSLLEKEKTRIENKVKRNSSYQYEEALLKASYGDYRSVFEELIFNAKQYLGNVNKKKELQLKIDELVDGRRVTEVNDFLDDMNVKIIIRQ